MQSERVTVTFTVAAQSEPEGVDAGVYLGESIRHMCETGDDDERIEGFEMVAVGPVPPASVGLLSMLEQYGDAEFECGEHNAGDDEPYEARYVRARALRAELLGVMEPALSLLDVTVEWMALSHYKCDTTQDVACYAEQYGDGDHTQHAVLREARAVLANVTADRT